MDEHRQLFIDKLQYYRGNDVKIDDLILRCPTLGEVCDYGDNRFLSMAHHFCAIPTDYMDELDAAGIRYEDLDEYEFFITNIFPSLADMNIGILFPNLNITQMQLVENTETKEILQVDWSTGFQFNKETYNKLIPTLRNIFGFEYAPKIAGTALTREKMIEAARQQKLMAKNKSHESFLLPLISALINTAEFKYNHREVWGMPFFAFMDSVRRIQAVKVAHEMSTGGYFGLKLSEVKEYLDWMRDL